MLPCVVAAMAAWGGGGVVHSCSRVVGAAHHGRRASAVAAMAGDQSNAAVDRAIAESLGGKASLWTSFFGTSLPASVRAHCTAQRCILMKSRVVRIQSQFSKNNNDG